RRMRGPGLRARARVPGERTAPPDPRAPRGRRLAGRRRQALRGRGAPLPELRGPRPQRAHRRGDRRRAPPPARRGPGGAPPAHRSHAAPRGAAAGGHGALPVSAPGGRLDAAVALTARALRDAPNVETAFHEAVAVLRAALPLERARLALIEPHGDAV